MSRYPAPAFGIWLLERLLPEAHREEVLGDLVEEYGIRAQSAPVTSVANWYWWQVCRSIPPLLWAAAGRQAWPSTVGVAIGAYVAAGAIEFAGIAAIARLLGPDARPLLVLSAIVGLATQMLGGYFAARIRPAAPAALAGIVMIAVVILMVTARDSAPLWYGLTFLIVGPLAALAGGILYRGRGTGGAGRVV